MDEAGKIIESDALIPLTMFGPVTTVLIGDHKQLKPIVKSKAVKGRQQFSAQLGLALFTRFMLAVGDAEVVEYCGSHWKPHQSPFKIP